MAPEGTLLQFNGLTTQPIDPARVVSAATDMEFERVAVVGVEVDGVLHIAGSHDRAETVLLRQRASARLVGELDE